jgi:hypothetical protein
LLPNEASYVNLLIKAKMPTQHIRRIRKMALETFKILNGLAPPVLSNYFSGFACMQLK